MTKNQAFAVFMGVVGLALIIWQAGWFVAIGIFLMLWANNLSEMARY